MKIFFDKILDHCPICGVSNIQFWRTKHKEGVEYHIFKCDQCTTAFLNPRVTNQTILDIYDKSGHGLTNPVTLDEILQREKEYPNSTIDSERIVSYAYQNLIKENQEKKMKALDIGSGYGFYSLCAKKYGFTVESINPGIYENDVCREMFKKANFPENIHVGLFEDFEFEKESFHFIILSQVLEHIKEPLSIMRKVADLLKPGGMIAIAIPNYNSIFIKLKGVRDNCCLWVPEHCNYFTETSLRYIGNDLNLKLTHIRHICRLPYYYFSNRFKLKENSLFRKISNKAFEYIQFLPCKEAERLKIGNYLNVFFEKRRNH